MTLEALRQAAHRAVGTNQTAKAIQRGQALVVFVAKDADPRVTESVVRAAQQKGLPLVQEHTKRELGRACGIAVDAAAAAILRGPASES
ncbi:MAG: ribosomal L7Ae/L30e/S12e/Gadd45 family protein [Armatimonadota bacterium]|nr:ribosomal L7Ae/L30e/S12e/Gadd45 family protein [Armatimonadota bacterium]MDR7443045.1 ribosomal L7Ae/L30e/S12e/Gadd45 family protein [Armatimonadota bacterium]MDR7569352.1 ribosomal L7Ae/L30e/S12e/Gadd45 family protein [Armatimonadota bacterium]MDR7614501.1 ribosomal L7Ae/L30e/S12e/Gadd45 family protein [Armatimonadota bacterium]